ncbi:MAG: beta-ketoacyl-ACP synthase II [Spirochaetia bacterium]|nr:beta-ketoacyl-ACP synthase II [Spirochaetia bacterium]
MKKRIVITGMGALTPVGNNVNDTWQALQEGKNGIGRITLFDASGHSTQIAGEIKGFDPTDVVDKKEARRMPRFIQYGLKVAREAIGQSGIMNYAGLNKDRVAVLLGSGIGGINVIEEQQMVLAEKGPGKVSPFLIPMLIPNMAGAFVSIKYGFRGPNFTIVTACATGTHSIGEGMKLLMRGDADVCIAGGTEGAVTPLGLAGFCSAQSLSERNDDPEHASRPFDRDRTGFVMADGAGIMVLETLEHAQARKAVILAEMAGYGCSDDAYHITAMPADGAGAILCMKNALADAGIEPGEVSYINAHGTSTDLNDRTESKAIKAVFGDAAYRIPVSSTKSMTGHMLGGTGAVEGIVCALSCMNNVIHPTRNFVQGGEGCDLDYVPNTKRATEVNYALSNSFGFGGHNATIILKKYR